MRNLPMYTCRSCGLLWLQRYQLSPDFYANTPIWTGEDILRRRVRDSADRVRTFARICPLDYTCDIGAADGSFLKSLSECGYRFCWGIEPNANGAEISMERGLTVVHGAADAFPSFMQTRPTKVVTLLQLLEHLADPLKILLEIVSALPKGARVICETVDRDAYAVRKYDAYISIYHTYYFNQRNLNLLFAKAGLSIEAAGRRDFDGGHLSIGECLRRLGLRRTKVQRINESPVTQEPFRELGPDDLHEGDSRLKRIARFACNGFVRLCRRQNLLWMIGVKQ